MSIFELYLDEALPPAEMAELERRLRDEPELLAALAQVHARRDAGVHSLGEVWRLHRLSCPSRETLGSFLLQAMSAEQSDYVRFHLKMIGCRYCQANLADLEEQAQEDAAAAVLRRTKYFQSSAGRLRG